MNKKKKQVTSVIVATAFTLTTVINAVPTVVYAHEANKQMELDMYGNTSTDMILYNTEYISVNEETIPEIESVITDNLDNTVEVISSDTTWDVEKTLCSNLVVNPGVTLTINAKVTISGDVTISGGGIIKRGGNYTKELISVPENRSLTLENITLDGGAVYSGETNSLLNRGTENIGIDANGALVHSSGLLNINKDTKLENNFWESSGWESAAVSVAAGITTINGGVICNNYGGAFGGGIYVAKIAELNLNGGTICYNNARDGAGIFTLGKLNMTSGECSYNYANGVGGGIRIGTGGNVHINGGSISNNQADKEGGGIYQYGKSALEVSGGEISYNTSNAGGGIYSYTGGYVVTIRDGAKIHHNYSNTNGGGIRAASDGKLSIEGGEIYENKSKSSGGGIFTWGCEVYLKNGTIAENKISNDKGGGLYIMGCRKLLLGDVIIKGNELINLDNSTKDDIAIGNIGRAVYLSRTDDSGELHFSSFEYPIVFKPLDDQKLSINTLKKMSYKSNSGKQNYQMWFNSSDENIYATKIITNGGEIPFPIAYEEDKLAEPIKDGHIFMGWYDNETFEGSQLTTRPEHTKTYYAKWEKSKYEVPAEVAFTSVYGAIESKEFSVQSNDGNPKVKSVISSNEDIFTVKVDDSDASKVIITPVSNLKAGTYSEKITVVTAAETTHTVTVNLTVNKADPTPTIPTDLTSLTGMKLYTVELPKVEDGLGTWSWENGDSLVNNDGIHTYQAIFTPNDTENYNTLKVGIKVKGEIGWTIENGVQGEHWKYEDGVFTFIKTGDYVIDGKNIQTGDCIIVSENFQGTIKLRNVKISAPDYAMVIENRAELTLMVDGENELRGGTNRSAGIKFNKATKGYLIIDSNTNGSLNVIGQNGTGIGGANGVIKINDDIKIKGGNVIGNITGKVNISGGNYDGEIQGDAIIDGGNVLIRNIPRTIKNSKGEDLVPVEIRLINSEVDNVVVNEININISGSFNNGLLTIYVPRGDVDKKYNVTITDSEGIETDNEVIVTPNEKPKVTIQNRWITNPSIESIFYGNKLTPKAEPLKGKVVFQYSTTEDGEYSTTEPRKVGTYWMKAVVAKGNGYTALESESIKFEIKQVSQSKPEECIDVVLNLKSNTMAVGDKVTLNLENKPKNASYTWSSSNKKVASVNSKGIVTGKKNGVATITCTVKVGNVTKKLTAKINVLQLKKEVKTRTVIAGEKITLKVENYKNATYTWSSSNENVAIVSSKGVVTGLKAGETTIRCKVDSPTKSYFVQYKVKVNSE